MNPAERLGQTIVRRMDVSTSLRFCLTMAAKLSTDVAMEFTKIAQIRPPSDFG